MKAILNIHKLSNILASEDIAKLEANALENKLVLNILFKVQAVNENDIYIQTTQGKNANGNIADNELLIRLTKDLFQPFFPTKIISVYPSLFLVPVVDVVTPEWINEHLHKYKIKIKNLSEDTGIDKSNFSAWINGIRPMSQIVKAMIFSVVKIYSLKEFANWLNEDSPYSSHFIIKKYFDLALIKTILYNNKNIDKYNVKFRETENDYFITLNPIK
jgi:hypothetical protein